MSTWNNTVLCCMEIFSFKMYVHGSLQTKPTLRTYFIAGVRPIQTGAHDRVTTQGGPPDPTHNSSDTPTRIQAPQAQPEQQVLKSPSLPWTNTDIRPPSQFHPAARHAAARKTPPTSH